MILLLQDEEEVQELENELSNLKSQLTEEQDKNVRLIDKMKKLKKKFKVPVSIDCSFYNILKNEILRNIDEIKCLFSLSVFSL
jgi:predicted RNase H-like nuclease (RuvC/YqgF family)